MKRKGPLFDLTGCISCGICVQACPFSCLRLSLEGRQGKYRNVFPQLVSEKCIGCGACASACPMDCIIMTEKSDES